MSPGDINPLSQLEVEREIMRLSQRLSGVTEQVTEAATNEARTEVAYKRAHARKWLALRSFDGTIPEKEAEALNACINEFEAMKIAEAVHSAAKEAGRNLRAQLDALRSINANTRASITYATGRGG